MKVAILSAGFETRSMRLQPHRTLLEMGGQLVGQGHQVVLVSDGASTAQSEGELAGMPLCRVPTVNLHPGKDNPHLCASLDAIAPDVILWHLSLSSFYHQTFAHAYASRTIGVITSPVYDFGEALRLGFGKLSSNPELIATHLIGTLVPGRLIRRALGGSQLRGVITLSHTTRQYLLRKGAPADRVWVVPPGVDRSWLNACLSDEERASLRSELGFDNNQFIVVYFGSPAPVRGLHTTLKAVERAAQANPELGMIVLSRRHGDEWQKQAAQLDALIEREGLRNRVKVVDGFLEQEQLIRYILAGDVVCLPFELVPSDVPLSILESMALSMGVISTEVACIPELLADGRGFLVPPASVGALSRQIQRLADQPGLAGERGKVGSTYIHEQRTWAHMGQALAHVLDGSNGN